MGSDLFTRTANLSAVLAMKINFHRNVNPVTNPSNQVSSWYLAKLKVVLCFIARYISIYMQSNSLITDYSQ